MNKPNVLFLLKGLETGGLEVVTAVLANKFVAEGHSVSVFAFLGGKNSIADRFDKRIICKMIIRRAERMLRALDVFYRTII